MADDRLPALMIGEELQRARNKAGLSQEQLAEKAGVHRTYISLLERNLRSPTVDVLVRVCRAMHIRASDLLKRIEE
jgi:transcriptional regulator with XRE-family HTH domain